MKCWHCNCDLVNNYQTDDLIKFYHCSKCDKWYELRKDKERVNGAVPVRFFELDSRPQLQTATAVC